MQFAKKEWIWIKWQIPHSAFGRGLKQTQNLLFFGLINLAWGTCQATGGTVFANVVAEGDLGRVLRLPLSLGQAFNRVSGSLKTLPKFIEAGFDMGWMERRPRRSRGPGPETATVALDVRSYSEHQRRALLAHRTQISPESFLVSLPPELRSLAFATAYFVRLSPPSTSGEHEPDLLDGLDETLGVV